MPSKGWSLHLNKSLNTSYEMKIKSPPTNYITLQLLHSLPLLLIELWGDAAPHFNTRGPHSESPGPSLISTSHPQKRLRVPEMC